MNFDLKFLEKLANIVYEQDLSEISLENEDKAICIRREKQVEQVVQPSAYVLPSTVTSQVVSPQVEAPSKTEEVKAVTPKGTPIVAPMIGTFYSSPSPDDAPFVKVGDTVANGQIVCIIEAMKLMNEIEAEVSGKITEICVENGQAVEVGQVLMYVE